MANYCIFCGSELGPSDRFCTKCGHKIEDVLDSGFHETEVLTLNSIPEDAYIPAHRAEDVPSAGDEGTSIMAEASQGFVFPYETTPAAEDNSTEQLSVGSSAGDEGTVNMADNSQGFVFPDEAALAVGEDATTMISGASSAGDEGTTIMSEPSQGFAFPAEGSSSAGDSATTVLSGDGGFVFPPEGAEAKGSEETTVLDKIERTTVLDDDDLSTVVLTSNDEASSFEEEEATTILVETRYFLVREENGDNMRITLPCVIGRGKNANYKVKGNLAVSREHVRISKQGERYIVEDLSSTNSTYVNDVVLPAGGTAPINNGESIRLGNESFTFVIEG